MSGELTQAGANRAVQAGVGQAVSAAAGMYLAMATGLPDSPDTASFADFAAKEITTAGYQRQQVAWSNPSGDPSALSNNAIINFGTFTADPPEVTHVFLCTASTGTNGSVLAYWELDTAKDAASGDSLQFAAGALTMSVD